jgi:hypothetical protein
MTTAILQGLATLTRVFALPNVLPYATGAVAMFPRRLRG